MVQLLNYIIFSPEIFRAGAVSLETKLLKLVKFNENRMEIAFKKQ